jgi:hypothetical protein
MRPNVLPVILAAAAVHSTASAAIWHHDWAFWDGAGGWGNLDDNNIHINGGDAGFGGSTQFTTKIWTKTQIDFAVDYSSVDSGQFDYFYMSINGARYPLIYNETQGTESFSYWFNPGDEVTFGVHTEDGSYGPGIARVYNLQAYALLEADQRSWGPWSYAGSGSVDLPPPNLHVLGGDAGHYDRTEGYLYTTIPMWSYIGGSYSSIDGGNYDRAYYYTQNEGIVPFINNETQGTFSPFWVYVPALQNLALGVETEDGQFGPGELTVTTARSYVYPGAWENFPWWPEDTCGGSIEWGVGGANAHGGNAGFGGHTQFYTQAYYNHHIEASFYYWNDGDNGDYDRAYYVVNGVRTYIANNDTQGGGTVDFKVPAGAYWGFGVETEDGQYGAGHLGIWAVRGWATPPQKDCYADCDGSGILDFFDFLCYTNLFNAGSMDADCDGNGGLDFFDFLCFTNEFNAGC